MNVLPEYIACPLCDQALVNLPDICHQCRNYYKDELSKIDREYSFLDLTPESSGQLVIKKNISTSIFQNPFISFLYEGVLPPIWATGLRNKGIEQEFKEVQEFFDSQPQRVLDLCCGTGVVTRPMAVSGCYQQVIALDYSGAMLTILSEQMTTEGIESSQILRVRGDVEKLPLLPDSIDAVYSGAAMHCWSDPQLGINNIYQVLRSGGKFYGTTFLQPLPNLVFRFFTIPEIQEIMYLAGFESDKIQLIQHGLYIIIKAIK